MTTLAITGSTGRVGGAAAWFLADASFDQTLLVRDPERAPALPRATVRQTDFGDTAAAREALAGIDVLFMVSGSESATRREDQVGFVAAAADAGVRHTVYLSFLGAAPDATFTFARTHFDTEQAIRDSGMDFTFLRDSFYADIVPLWVGADGVLRGPGGEGRVSVVARRDAAEVAAAVLRDPAAFRGRTLNVTGPVALTLDEIAAVLTERWGRSVRYQDETLAEAHRSRAAWDPEPWQMEGWVSTYTAIAAGEAAAVTDDVERVLGRPATPFAEVPLP